MSIIYNLFYIWSGSLRLYQRYSGANTKKVFFGPYFSTELPVILSSTFSKLIEMYIMYENDNFIFNNGQFGFIKSRGTASVVSVVHDVGTYCVQNGSQMYICSLDAEGTFDAILHPVLFAKTLNVISNMSWRLLYCWYTDMTINIKWKYLSRDIPISPRDSSLLTNRRSQKV